MTRNNTLPRGDFLDLFLTAASGVFPAAALEALIARMEDMR